MLDARSQPNRRSPQSSDREVSQGGIGHSTCSLASHSDLKEIIRSWLEYRGNWPEALPEWLAALTADDQRQLGGWIKTQRPWPGTTLLIGECIQCRSTLAVCGACRDEGMVETGSGPGAREGQCDCSREDAPDAWGDAREVA